MIKRLVPPRILLDPNPDAAGGADPAPEPAPVETPDPLLSVIMRDLNGGVPEIIPAADPAVAAPADPPSDPATPATPAAAPAPTPPAPAPTPSKPSKIAVVSGDDFPAEPVEIKKPAQANPPPDDTGFSDDQREELLEARTAARLFPSKYSTLDASLRKWYGELDEKVRALQAEDPNRSLDETDAGYQALLKSKPRIASERERAKVQREIGADEATRRVREEFDPEINDVKFKAREIAEAPKIKATVTKFKQGLVKLLSGEQSAIGEVAKLALAGTKPEDIARDYALEFEIGAREVAAAESLVGEYLKFAHGVGRFDQNNQAHTTLHEFINREGERFARMGGKATVRGGKKFMPRAEYAEAVSKNPEVAKTSWTFSHEDVVNMLAYQAKTNIISAIKSEEELAARRGYQRKPKVESPKVEKSPDPEPVVPPKAKPSAAPVSSGKVETKDPNSIQVSKYL